MRGAVQGVPYFVRTAHLVVRAAFVHVTSVHLTPVRVARQGDRADDPRATAYQSCQTSSLLGSVVGPDQQSLSEPRRDDNHK